MLEKSRMWHITRDWISLYFDRFTTNFRGYVRLQSERISKGRLTMTDLWDEKNTNAWVATVWKERDGEKEWPKIFRPQRPEQFQIRLEKKTPQPKTGVEANRFRNKNLEILNEPPVFLKIKDIKKIDA